MYYIGFHRGGVDPKNGYSLEGHYIISAMDHTFVADYFSVPRDDIVIGKLGPLSENALNSFFGNKTRFPKGQYEMEDDSFDTIADKVIEKLKRKE